MTGVRLHLMRHGQAAKESPWRFLGQRDVPLSDEGRTQARFWREALAGVDFTAALCSDLSRCRETAGIILEGRPARAVPCVGLREIALGAWDGLTVEEVRSRHPGQYEARGNDLTGFAPPGGESFSDLQRRVLGTLTPWLDQAKGDVLVVAHAGVNRAFLCHVLGMPLEMLFRLGQAPCSRSILEFDRKGPVLSVLNQTPCISIPLP